MTAIDPEWLSALRCPAARTPLRPARPDELEVLNARIAGGQQHNVGGALVAEPLDAALAREGGDLFYPVRGGIPRLLVEEGLPLEADAAQARDSSISPVDPA